MLSTMSQEVSKAAQILRDGGLVAFPTETVYGLGADATNDGAVARIFSAKGRPQFNPLISHVADAEKAFQLGVFPLAAQKLAAAFWPGPLTIVVERRADCPVSLLCSAGESSLGLRVPDHPAALALMDAVDRPVAAPSANPSGRISPTTAQHVRDGLGNKVDFVLDGGPCEVGVESTVIRFVDDKATILRPGGLARDVIENCLNAKVMVHHQTNEGNSLYSPGLLESHYAPSALLRLNATCVEAGEAFLGFGQISHGALNLSHSGNVVEAAANLFRMLHELDARSPRRIAVAPIPYSGLGEAINDRLKRAAAPRP
jgi:L-threonylcarbamoyladenylate synthase